LEAAPLFAAARHHGPEVLSSALPEPEHWKEIGYNDYTIDGNEVKIEATIANLSGARKSATVNFKELKENADLPQGQIAAEFEPHQIKTSNTSGTRAVTPGKKRRRGISANRSANRSPNPGRPSKSKKSKSVRNPSSSFPVCGRNTKRWTNS
jgi:hypothetical protein